MEKHLFRCSSCGYEIYLQAWKAVCPRCEREYTLVRVIERVREPRIRPRFVGAALLFIYLLLTFITPEATVAGLAPRLPIQIALAAAALFLLTGSLPSIIISSLIGGGLLVYHLMISPVLVQQLILSALSTLILVAAIIEEVFIRRRKGRLMGGGGGDV